MSAAFEQSRNRQRGAAALEMALSLPILLILLYGVVTFGGVFYTQQIVSRAASDGARAVTFVPEPDEDAAVDYAPVLEEVVRSLVASVIVPSAVGGDFAARKTWLMESAQTQIQVQPDLSCNGAAAAGRVSVTVRLPYNDTAGTRILPSIDLPGFGVFETWMPDQLTACATVQLF